MLYNLFSKIAIPAINLSLLALKEHILDLSPDPIHLLRTLLIFNSLLNSFFFYLLGRKNTLFSFYGDSAGETFAAENYLLLLFVLVSEHVEILEVPWPVRGLPYV
jgi:hypothetical protein